MKEDLKFEELKEDLKWEAFNARENYSSIIDALLEVQSLICAIKNGAKRTDEELMESEMIITQPLFLYHSLLENFCQYVEDTMTDEVKMKIFAK